MVMYTVYCGERYVGKYLATSEKKAIQQATSTQTGNASHLYRAEAEHDNS